MHALTTRTPSLPSPAGTADGFTAVLIGGWSRSRDLRQLQSASKSIWLIPRMCHTGATSGRSWTVDFGSCLPVGYCLAPMAGRLCERRPGPRRAADGARPVCTQARRQRPGKTRWTRGHAVWVSDVFAWRGSPAAWREDLVRVVSASADSATPQERKALHRLGDGPVVATLTTDEDDVLRVAASAEHRSALSGPLTVPVGQP